MCVTVRSSASAAGAMRSRKRRRRTLEVRWAKPVRPPYTFPMLREFAPSARLAPWVEVFWTRDAFTSDAAVTQRVLPDGCADIVFADAAAVAVGTMTSPLVLTETRAPALLGVRFRPGRAPLG